VRRIIEAVDRELPLAASWNVGIWESGFHPNWQIETLVKEQGHMILPWFGMPKGDSWDQNKSYFENPLRFCAQHHLPISFRATQWENRLLKQADRPAADNPCLVRPDGNVTELLSPFGPVDSWYKVGFSFHDDPLVRKLQEIYPDPPLVLIFSNNEPKIANKVNPGNSARLAELLRERGIDSADAAAAEALVEEAWKIRYEAMIRGLRDAFVSQAWKDNSVFIPYGMFNNDSGYRDIMDWHKPHAWDGTSTHVYVSDWDWRRDWKVGSPQSEAAAVHASVNQVRRTKPDFFREMSVWHDGGGVVKQIEYKRDGTYTDARYYGMTQFLLWSIRPQIIREFRGSRERRADVGRRFYLILNMVGRVHEQDVLRDFWLNGRLVTNPPDSPRPRGVPPEHWAILPADVNAKVNWRDKNDTVAVFASALVKGDVGNREWLVFAHAPEGDRTGVVVGVPG
jgi:hypothetical protein